MNVVADVFPAMVALALPGSLEDINELLPRGASPAGTRHVDRCRAILLNNKLLIAVDTPTGANVVFNETYISHSKIDRIHRVTTESGKLIAFSKDDNCGCGSRLRSWNPYGSIITVGGEK